MSSITISNAPVAPLAYAPPAAAKVLGVSRSWLYEMIKRGELPAVRVGAHTFVRHADLQAVLDRATPVVAAVA